MAGPPIASAASCVRLLEFHRAADRPIHQTLHVFARVGPGGGEKLEFLFAARSDATPPLFTAAERVLRAYDGSRLYRDVKLRGALVVRGAPSLLLGETLLEQAQEQAAMLTKHFGNPKAHGL